MTDTIESLRDRVWELEEELRRLKADFHGDRYAPPAEWGLTQSEASIFGTLVANTEMTKEMALHALLRVGADKEPDIKIVDVFICKMRPKLKRFNVEIKTLWGRGYALDTALREELKLRASVPQ